MSSQHSTVVGIETQKECFLLTLFFFSLLDPCHPSSHSCQTFLIGLQSGFSAGKREGIAAAALAPASTPVRAEQTGVGSATSPSERRGAVQ